MDVQKRDEIRDLILKLKEVDHKSEEFKHIYLKVDGIIRHGKKQRQDAQRRSEAGRVRTNQRREEMSRGSGPQS